MDASYSSFKKKEGTFFGRNTEDSQDFQTKSSAFVEVLTLPNRVTLQPGPRTRRTPFDCYKNKDVLSGQVFNSTKRAAKSLGVSVQRFEDSLTKEIDELLGEIEASRREALSSSETDSAGVSKQDPTCGSVAAKPKTPKGEQTVLNLNQPSTFIAKGASLHKVRLKEDSSQLLNKGKGLFDPKSKRGRERVRTFIPVRRDWPPSPPTFRTSVSSDHDEQGTSHQADRIRSLFRDPQVLEDDEGLQVVLPDRPSFIHFAPAYGSLFDRYRGIPVAAPRPPPFRSVHARLGLSEEAFDALLKAEIDDILLTSAENRRCLKEAECVSTATLEQIPPLRVLSKDDCLRIFQKQGHPTSGSLLGVWWWAADLFRTRFNFEFDFAKDDLSILDAYD